MIAAPEIIKSRKSGAVHCAEITVPGRVVPTSPRLIAAGMGRVPKRT